MSLGPAISPGACESSALLPLPGIPHASTIVTRPRWNAPRSASTSGLRPTNTSPGSLSVSGVPISALRRPPRFVAADSSDARVLDLRKADGAADARVAARRRGGDVAPLDGRRDRAPLDVGAGAHAPRTLKDAR